MDDLVEQVVVQAGGRGETQELHGERGDEAQRDAGGTQDDEHLKIVALAATHNFHESVSPFLKYTHNVFSISDWIMLS